MKKISLIPEKVTHGPILLLLQIFDFVVLTVIIAPNVLMYVNLNWINAQKISQGKMDVALPSLPPSEWEAET